MVMMTTMMMVMTMTMTMVMMMVVVVVIITMMVMVLVLMMVLMMTRLNVIGRASRHSSFQHFLHFHERVYCYPAESARDLCAHARHKAQFTQKYKERG